MTFERVLPADLAAMVCALLLLFAMALDWYSTTAGQEARRIERSTEPQGALGGEVSRDVEERARASAESAEKNAFQASGAVDRLILAGLLATALLAVTASFVRAAGRRFELLLTPSAAAGVCACVTALLIAYRTVQQPGEDAGTTIEPGAFAGLMVLGLLALACAASLRAEQEGTAWREQAAAAGDAAEVPAGEPSIESSR